MHTPYTINALGQAQLSEQFAQWVAQHTALDIQEGIEEIYTESFTLELDEVEGFQTGDYLELAFYIHIEGRYENSPDPQYHCHYFALSLREATLCLYDEEEETELTYPLDCQSEHRITEILTQDYERIY